MKKREGSGIARRCEKKIKIRALERKRFDSLRERIEFFKKRGVKIEE